MVEKKPSAVYLVVALLGILSFVLAIVGVFLPLVGFAGESYTIYRFFSEGFSQIGKFGTSNPMDWAKIITTLFRDVFLGIFSLFMAIRLFIWFLKYLIRNKSVLARLVDDFYGEDIAKIALLVASYLMLMFSLFGSEWAFGIGMIFITIGGSLAILEIAILRLFEASKAEHKGKAFIHNSLMIVAAVLCFLSIAIGLQKILVDDSGYGIALLHDFLLKAMYALKSEASFTAYVLILFGIVLISFSFSFVEKCFLIALGCRHRSRRERKLGLPRRDSHVRGIVYSSLALGLFLAGLILLIVKAKEAFDLEYSIGTTGILTIVFVAVSLILFILCKVMNPSGDMLVTETDEGYEIKPAE